MKVLHKSELEKHATPSPEFCEIPLSEVRFEAEMRCHENIVELHESFEDAHCHYVVFELAEGKFSSLIDT